MHGCAQTLSEQVLASIIYDGRSGMSVAAFRTAAPIGGLSCYSSCLKQVVYKQLTTPGSSLVSHICFYKEGLTTVYTTWHW